MRKRRGLDARGGAFIDRLAVIVGRIAVVIAQVDVSGSLAFRHTDAGALSGPAACVGSTVTDVGACAVRGRVVLPAH